MPLMTVYSHLFRAQYATTHAKAAGYSSHVVCQWTTGTSDVEATRPYIQVAVWTLGVMAIVVFQFSPI